MWSGANTFPIRKWLPNSTQFFCRPFFLTVYFISVFNHTVKKIGGDSYFLLKLALLRTLAVSRRFGHVATNDIKTFFSAKILHTELWSGKLYLKARVDVNRSPPTINKASKKLQQRRTDIFSSFLRISS